METVIISVIMCCIAAATGVYGWWIENGPVKPEENKDAENNAEETEDEYGLEIPVKREDGKNESVKLKATDVSMEKSVMEEDAENKTKISGEKKEEERHRAG